MITVYRHLLPSVYDGFAQYDCVIVLSRLYYLYGIRHWSIWDDPGFKTMFHFFQILSVAFLCGGFSQYNYTRGNASANASANAFTFGF